MALIVITVSDSEQGADIGVLCEPGLDTSNPNVVLTAAQRVALDMLRAATNESPVKQDRGLIALIN